MHQIIDNPIYLLPIIIPIILIGLLVYRAMEETRENLDTVCALLRVKSEDRPWVRITYGHGLPFTLGHAHVMRIRVADKAIPHIVTPEEAVEAGVILMRSFDMDDAGSIKPRARYREWTLTR